MTSAPASLSVVVPLYQEAAGVAALCAALSRLHDAVAPQRPLEFVLVDDGSTDGTAGLLRATIDAAHPAWRVIEHDRNRGLTAALRTGSEAARFDLVAWLDADLSYDPMVLVDLLAAIDGGAEFATASCHGHGGRIDGVSAFRAMLSRQASRCYRWATGRRIATFTCMVRVQRRELLLATWPIREGFLGVTEQFLRVLASEARAVEVPATLRARRTGRSKLRVLKAVRAHLGLMWAAWRGSFRPPTAHEAHPSVSQRASK